MSEELKIQNEEEINKIVEEEAEITKEMAEDKCPRCLTPTSEFPYIIMIPQVGWVECPKCGTVFSPLSIRKQKLKQQKEPSLIVPAAVIPNVKL